MNGDIFKGTFLQGLKDGKGELRGVDGSIITGWWKENKLSGKGEWLHGDKRLYIGDFKDDTKHGQGVLTWPDKRKYEGMFSRNRMHGVGICGYLGNYAYKICFFVVFLRIILKMAIYGMKLMVAYVKVSGNMVKEFNGQKNLRKVIVLKLRAKIRKLIRHK